MDLSMYSPDALKKRIAELEVELEKSKAQTHLIQGALIMARELLGSKNDPAPNEE
jgi:hypothetical protein